MYICAYLKGFLFCYYNQVGGGGGQGVLSGPSDSIDYFVKYLIQGFSRYTDLHSGLPVELSVQRIENSQTGWQGVQLMHVYTSAGQSFRVHFYW